jgi:hypothetical protein
MLVFIDLWRSMMATVKKGHLTAAREWWKHLKWTKRSFWKRERTAARKSALKEQREALD